MDARIGGRRVRNDVAPRSAEHLAPPWPWVLPWRRPAVSLLSHLISCRLIAWIVTTVAIVAFTATFLLTRHEQPSSALVESATVTVIGGDVEVRPVGAAAFFPAHDGMILHVGDAMRTGPAGRCTLTYFEGSRQEVGPTTSATLARLDLTAGSRPATTSDVVKKPSIGASTVQPPRLSPWGQVTQFLDRRLPHPWFQQAAPR